MKREVFKGLVVGGLVFLVTMGLLPGGIVPSAYSNETAFSPEFRLMSLLMCAYTVSDTVPSEQAPFSQKTIQTRPAEWWVEQEKRLLGLSDEAFETELRLSIESVMASFDPQRMHWDPEFLETILKKVAPDLIDSILRENGTETQGSQSLPLVAYVPGNNTATPAVYGYNVFGVAMWGFFCRITWWWDTTMITSVLPSSYGEVYGISSWTYDGVNATQQYYNSPIDFYKWIEGKFTLWAPWPNVIPIQHAWPGLNIDVYAGGGYAYSSYIRH